MATMAALHPPRIIYHCYVGGPCAGKRVMLYPPDQRAATVAKFEGRYWDNDGDNVTWSEHVYLKGWVQVEDMAMEFWYHNQTNYEDAKRQVAMATVGAVCL